MKTVLSIAFRDNRSVMAQNLIIFCCIAVTLLPAHVLTAFTKTPANTAAEIGSEAVLECHVDNLGTDAISWEFYPNNSNIRTRIYQYSDGEGAQMHYPDDYYVLDEPGTNFDLTIKETATASAGRYECGLFNENDSEPAQMVSVSAISCSPPPGSQELPEGAVMILTCEVEYTGYKAPSFTWTYLGTNLAGTYTSNYERSSLRANVTADGDLDMVEFFCDLAFITEGGDVGEAPEYNDSCSTYFLVQHGATGMIISPDPDDVVAIEVGETVNCTASGRPAPDIYWEDSDGPIIESAQLIIQEEWAGITKSFECVAFNYIDGNMKEARLGIELLVSEIDDPGEVTTGGMEPWLIAVIIVVPLLVIGAVTGGVVYYLKKKKKKKKKKAAATVAVTGSPHNGRPFDSLAAPYANQPGYQRQPSGGHRSSSMGGLSINTPEGATSPQQALSGKDSPGYGDLGIKHFSGSTPGLNSSVDLDPDAGFVTMDVSRAYGQLEPQPVPRKRPSNQDLSSNPNRYGSRGSLSHEAVIREMSASQASLNNPVPRPRNPKGSQSSLAYQAAAIRNQMIGSQASLGYPVPAAQGTMGSRGSLASHGSRGHGNPQMTLPNDMPDTTV